MGGSLICEPLQNNRAVGKRDFVVTRLLFTIAFRRCFKMFAPGWAAQIFSTETDSKIRFAIMVKENGANIESIRETCVHWKDRYYDENRVDRVRCPDRQDSHCFHQKSDWSTKIFFFWKNYVSHIPPRVTITKTITWEIKIFMWSKKHEKKLKVFSLKFTVEIASHFILISQSVIGISRTQNVHYE